MNEVNRMTRDRDAFVFYSALVIAVLSLFIGHEGTPETAASAASPAAQALPARDAAARPPAHGGGQALVVAVSHRAY